MKPGKDSELFQQALTDPALELSADVLAGLSPEELTLYNRNRYLDRKLQDGFSELSAQIDARAPDQENFLKELANRLDHAEQEAATTDSAFFRKLQWQSFFVRMRELMVYSPGAPYRWAPALLLLIAAGLAPILVERDANGDAGDNLTLSGKAGGVTEKLIDKPDAPDGNLTAPGPGTLPDGPGMENLANQVETEVKLLAQLAAAEQAKDKAARKAALEALEKHYQASKEATKLEKIRKRLKSL